MAVFDITTAEGSDSVCYVLLPEGAVPDMVRWAEKAPCFGNARLYLSLGAKEKNAPDRRMATVEDATREVVDLLEGKGFDVTFEMVPGTHFSPAAPKFDRALEILLAESVESVPAGEWGSGETDHFSVQNRLRIPNL